jgi:hypothetical protein
MYSVGADGQHAVLETLGVAHDREERVAEFTQSVHAACQRCLEGGNTRELAGEAQQLSLVARAIDDTTPLAEGVTKNDIR